MAVRITRFQRLPGNPRNPNMDQTWWEADVVSESAFYTVYVWTPGASNDDAWARSELEKLGAKHGVGKLYGFSPIELPAIELAT